VRGLSGFDAIVLICATGTRAASAVNVLAKVGFKNIHRVVDGFNGWKNNGPNGTGRSTGKKVWQAGFG